LKLVRELKERHFIQLLTGYLAGGWVVLEVVDQLTNNGVLPTLVYSLALTLLLSGIPATAVIAWYHGAKGEQKPPPREIVMLTVIGVVGLAATAYVARRNLAEAEPVSTAGALDRLDPTDNPSRIAVLYFDARGSNDEAELLASGITETLIDELSQVPAIHVVSRNGVAPLRGRASFPTDSVAEALQVGTFVRGQVAESDSTVQVKVEVVRAANDQNVGSRTIRRPRSELFQLQDDIASQVAVWLRETVGEEVRLATDQSSARNVDAWLLVQKAADAESEATRLVGLDDVDGAAARMSRADSLLAEAERIAPDWSEPTTRRGWLDYEQARWGGLDRAATPDLLASGREQANRALAKNPRDADALELRGTIEYWSYLLNLTSEPGEAQRLVESAEEDFNAATTANPSQASAYSSLSHLLMNQGRTAQAKLAAEKSYEADPWLLNANLTLWRLFQASLDLQDEQEARKWCDVGASRFPTDYHFHECRVWLYALPGNPAARAAGIDTAWAQCDSVVAHSPPALEEYNRKSCQMIVAMGLAQAELPDSARRVAQRARAGTDVDPVRDLAWLEAIVLTQIGDYQGAVDRLALYLAANPGQVASFARDDTWWLQDLRSYPGYQRLVESR
jgi:serine/threonine-protein kinase